MNALILTSGGLIAAKVLSAWLSTGHSVAVLWIGSKNRLRKDRTLRIAAPNWSIEGVVRRYNIPVRRHPKLSTWTQAEIEIQRLHPDVLITAATDQIVPERILAHFAERAVNFHGSILPDYRGPHPLAGMMLDGTAHVHGGITLHCLARGIDTGDIIGIRKVPYDPHQGYVHWHVRLARAAGSLVQEELQSYLKGSIRPCPQPSANVKYRKLRADELVLSSEMSTSRTKWLCDQFGDTGLLRFPSGTRRKYVMSHFVRRIGSRAFEAERISKRAIEFDTIDARVRVSRPRRWTLLMRTFKYWLAIARTSFRM
jgi:methionyl-tRNA formyltransferase